MLLTLVGWELFPFPSRFQVNFSLSISALRSDDTLQSFASLLLSSRSLSLRTAFQEEAESEVCDVDNAQLPAYS